MWWISTIAFAGVPGYQACCTAAAVAACPTELSVAGPGSASTVEGAAARLTGIWTLACDGRAVFDPAASQVTASRSVEGAVISPIAQAGALCFDAACALPAALCVVHDGGRAQVVACTDGKPPSADLWKTLPVEDTRAAVVSGKPLKVRDTVANSAPPTVPVASALATSTTATTTRASASSAGVDLSVPDAPPDPCRPTARRTESTELGDAGNTAAFAGDYATALTKYRAAITANSCNAFAWADLGDALLTLREAGRAKLALEVATRLMPTHYRAWTHLGAACETLGDPASAAIAYRKALAAHEGFGPAMEGLARTGAR